MQWFDFESRNSVSPLTSQVSIRELLPFWAESSASWLFLKTLFPSSVLSVCLSVCLLIFHIFNFFPMVRDHKNVVIFKFVKKTTIIPGPQNYYYPTPCRFYKDRSRLAKGTFSPTKRERERERERERVIVIDGSRTWHSLENYCRDY